MSWDKRLREEKKIRSLNEKMVQEYHSKIETVFNIITSKKADLNVANKNDLSILDLANDNNFFPIA